MNSFDPKTLIFALCFSLSLIDLRAQGIGRPPVITNQPASQIVGAGSNVVLTVGVAPSVTPLSFRWRKGNFDIAGATNASLVFTNIKVASGGNYSVLVANGAGSVSSDTATLTVVELSPNQSVSLGADVTLRLNSRGAPLTGIQWRFNESAIARATEPFLMLINVQLANAGAYSVSITTAAGTITLAAKLEVDPAFTKIQSGEIATTRTYNGAWGDANADGFPDLFTANLRDWAGTPDFLFHNQRDGTFGRTVIGPATVTFNDSSAGAWADYDNDGNLDLFVARGPISRRATNALYRGGAGGLMTSVQAGHLTTETGVFSAAAWADYDGDGFADLYVVNSSSLESADFLFRNNGNGTFSRVNSNPVADELTANHTGAWSDYDQDGDMDLFVPNAAPQGNSSLFVNLGSGLFQKISSGPALTGIVNVWNAAWGDFDNDGFQDLFLGNNGLFRNRGDGTFQQVADSGIVESSGVISRAAAWADYDNDGWLDLFVGASPGGNRLFRNNGRGRFIQITSGSIANDPEGSANDCAWVDYDNNGFVDLFVANGAGGPIGPPNYLYRNNGNENSWIQVQCIGRLSNRAAIGARVRIKTRVLDMETSQLREISSGSVGQYNLRAHFGIGDAAIVDTLRIEWPSGIVQELRNVLPKQFLTVTEPVLLIEPKTIAFVPGNDVQFILLTNSTPGTNYQWRKDGADLPGETNRTFLVSGLRASSAGKYTLLIQLADGGTVESRASVIPPPVPPSIIEQPQNQISEPGETVSFGVLASGTQPISYQWRLNEEPIANATNAMLTISNAQTNHTGAYDVIVSNVAGSMASATASLRFIGAPFFARVPKSQSVSVGANVTFQAFATGTLPLNMQWLRNGIDIPNATNSSLRLTNAQLSMEGRYSVRVVNSLGTATTEALLDIDSTFTKITSGPIVTEKLSPSAGASWADYDNDGLVDLFVGQMFNRTNNLYHNEGGGRFSKVTANPVVDLFRDTNGSVWADYDNDGFLDLFVANYGDRHFLFHNLKEGKFERILSAPIGTDSGASGGAAWGDYDNDGLVDLFIPQDVRQSLYRNKGDGTFVRVTADGVTTDRGRTVGSSWADYNNDGLLDLFVATHLGGWDFTAPTGTLNYLYRNLGGGSFQKITAGDIATDLAASWGAAWGDYDNDSFLDLFILNTKTVGGGAGVNFLYRNLQDGRFRKVPDAGPIVTDPAQAWDAAWADYDNDGYLDLFVANLEGPNNALYRNRGDGTFEKITSGSLVNDRDSEGHGSISCTWGDYDNDGFLDLFAGNGGDSRQENYLYRNSGNGNGWLKLKCIGTFSNRAGIGVKVRILATISGKTFWQLREISGGGGHRGQNGLLPHFGLGDASIIKTVRIEWTSGIVQEFYDLAPKQSLTIVEPEIGIDQILPSGSSTRIQSTEAAAGSEVTLQVRPLRTHPRLQWIRDGVEIQGATNNSLRLINLSAADRGRYAVVLGNPSENVRTASIRLNVRVLQFVSSVTVNTLAGAAHPPFPLDPGPNAEFNLPNGGAVDSRGNVHIADTPNHRILIVSAAGAVTVLAGTGQPGLDDGPAATARFNSPIGVAVDADGNVFVTESGTHRIRKIAVSGTVTTIAGGPSAGYRDGAASEARFNFPNDVVVDSTGNLYISEFLNHTIRKITLDGRVTTVAGQGGNPGYADGRASESFLHKPGGIAIDQHGTLFVTEWSGHRIRRITSDGTVTTVAGNGLPGYVDGPVLEAQFNTPDGIVVDRAGNIYITEFGNDVIRRITPEGRVETVAGTSVQGQADGLGTEAQFYDPGGIGMDLDGNLYIADTANRRVRKITIAPAGGGLKLLARIDPAKSTVELMVTAPQGKTFSIETSLNLRDWTPLATLQGAAEPVHYTDPVSAAVGSRFYRARILEN